MLANKKIFIKGNDVHFGRARPEKGYKKGSKDEVVKILAGLGPKKIWRCFVCNDLHIGDPPEECPTCLTKDAYCEITAQEFKILTGINE